MDDHMYMQMMDYAKCELIPRFQEEYKKTGKLSACPSYEEIQDLCTALNAVGKWAGFERVSPSSFVEAI